ncbi:hypothetical protein EP331_04730 [bacterium]|nr:MAG: hypothetical protein EP331_04730 [bacterium]
MKFLSILSILFLTLFFNVLTIQAQHIPNVSDVEHAIKPNGKYAILVRTNQHLKAAIKTGSDFKTQHKTIDFQIITCGALVKEIATDESLKTLINEAHQQGITTVICGLSVRNLSVDTSLLPEKALQSENGLTYLFGLQELGYKTISL